MDLSLGYVELFKEVLWYVYKVICIQHTILEDSIQMVYLQLRYVFDIYKHNMNYLKMLQSSFVSVPNSMQFCNDINEITNSVISNLMSFDTIQNCQYDRLINFNNDLFNEQLLNLEQISLNERQIITDTINNADRQLFKCGYRTPLNQVSVNNNIINRDIEQNLFNTTIQLYDTDTHHNALLNKNEYNVFDIATLTAIAYSPVFNYGKDSKAQILK